MRTLGLVLAVCLPFVLLGCGDDDGQDNNNSHVIVDAAIQQDSAIQQDALVQQDAMVQQDSALQQDSSTQPGNGITGDPCSDANQCGGITNGTPACITNLLSFITFPGGYCSSQSCTVGTACDSGNGVCIDPTGMGFAAACLQTCTSGTECRESEGYSCTTLPVGSDTQTYCLPDSGMNLGDGGFTIPDGGFTIPDGGF